MRFRYTKRKVAKPFANCGDSDQMLHSVASDLDLHCLPITLLGVSRLLRKKRRQNTIATLNIQISTAV